MTAGVNQEGFKRFFTEFSSFLDTNFSRPTDPAEKNAIRNDKRRIRRLDSLARLVIKNDTDNCAAIALVNNQWIFTANDYDKVKDNIKKLLTGLRKITKPKDISEAKKFLLTEYLDQETNTNSYHYNHLVRDVKKVLNSFKNANIFSEGEINAILSEQPHVYGNKKKLHAELRLLSSLINQSENKTIALGISKLCCRLCASAVNAIRKVHPTQNVQIRGRHGNFYYGWKMPQFLLQNEYFQQFVGNKAFKEFTNVNPDTQEYIHKVISDLESNKTILGDFFTPQRGAVNVKSDSPAPTTESSTSSENELEEETPVSDSDNDNKD